MPFRPRVTTNEVACKARCAPSELGERGNQTQPETLPSHWLLNCDPE